VEARNYLACRAWEHWKERLPIRGNNVWGPNLSRKRDRLAVGLRFDYAGYQPTVTSFSCDTHELIACTYKPRSTDTYGSAKVEQRFRLSQADIAQDAKDMKWKRETADAMILASTSKRDVFMAKLGNPPTMREYYRLSRERIERALEASEKPDT